MSVLIRCCVTRRRCRSHDVRCRRRCRRHVKSQSGASAPSVIEVDLLDLDAPTGSDAEDENHPTQRICNTRPDRPANRRGS